MTTITENMREDGPKDTSFLSSVGRLPVAAAALEQATALYAWAKAKNEYLRYGLERGETLTKDAAAKISGSTIGQQVANRLHPLDTAACQKLEELKQSYPVINQPHDVIFNATRERLSRLVPVGEYTQVARQTQDLLKTQLQQNYDVAKTKTTELVKTMQEQTQAVMQYSKNVNLEQASQDIKKAFEATQAYISSTLAGAQQSAKNQATAVKTTIEGHVTAIRNSQILAPLQQQLEALKTQMDNLVATVMGSLNPQQRASIESLQAKVEETVKAWVPVKDHLLAYFVSQEEQPVPVDAPTHGS